MGLVRSTVIYGLQAWGNTTQTYLTRVDQLQTRILKTICKTDRTRQLDNLQWYREMDVLPCTKLFTYVTILQHYYSDKYKTTVEHEQTTRQVTDKKLQVPRIQNDYGRQTLRHTVPRLFNKLPADMRQLTKYKTLKAQLQTWLHRQ